MKIICRDYEGIYYICHKTNRLKRSTLIDYLDLYNYPLLYDMEPLYHIDHELLGLIESYYTYNNEFITKLNGLFTIVYSPNPTPLYIELNIKNILNGDII